MNKQETVEYSDVYKRQEEILTQIKKAFVGKKDVARKILMTMLAGGHVLLEDIPGVGKTTLAVAFSNATDLQYKRIQFTPDVLPSDITGFSIFHRETGAMEYQPGAAICNLLLAEDVYKRQIQYRLKRDILHTDIRAPEMAALRGWEEEQQIHLSYMQEAGS